MPFQRASEEKLRTRRIVSVGGRFRRAAAETPDAPADETSRSTSTVDSRRRPPPRSGTGEPPYVGAYARSESASSYLENKIRYLNRQKYDMFNENCQYYSKAVAEECIRDEDRGNLAVV